VAIIIIKLPFGFEVLVVMYISFLSHIVYDYTMNKANA